MTTGKESKYAAQLRAMGFSKVPEAIRNCVRKIITTGRKVEYDKLMPTYTPGDDFTFATDETGEAWMATGRKNLSLMGFRDNVDWMKPSDGKKPN